MLSKGICYQMHQEEEWEGLCHSCLAYWCASAPFKKQRPPWSEQYTLSLPSGFSISLIKYQRLSQIVCRCSEDLVCKCKCSSLSTELLSFIEYGKEPLTLGTWRWWGVYDLQGIFSWGEKKVNGLMITEINYSHIILGPMNILYFSEHSQ